MAQKSPIGKLLLEKKKIDQEQLGRALEHQKKAGGRLASNLLELGLAAEEDLLSALGEQQGVPAVDISRSIIPLRFLDLVPEHVATNAGVMPLLVEFDRVVLGMGDPEDKQTIDEVQFVTGKKVDPYIALEARIRNAIRESYALRKRDRSIEFYRGERAEFPKGKEDKNGYLHIIAQQLPEPDVTMETEEELITIEVSTNDEVLDEVEVKPEAVDGKTLLVVDDEADIVNLLETALTKEGFKVVSAMRGLEALQAVKKHKPSLVLLDAMLPEIHGFEICRKIKTSKRFGHIPVVMVSAVYKGWRYAEDVKSTYGADDFFEKPFRIVPLVRRVKELLNAGPVSLEAELDPDAANQAYQKGVALYKQKNYEEARETLQEACKLDPFSANIHYALANVLLATNKVFEAIREYEHTVELKPDLFVPLKNLAILYQKKGFKNKAVEMWERALRCSPDDETRQEVKEQLIKLL